MRLKWLGKRREVDIASFDFRRGHKRVIGIERVRDGQGC